MPDSQDFNPNKDINRYLAQQGRAPQSHFDWETWRKVGQPGTYQAPPGGSTRFQPTRAGVGAPNYNSGKSNYDMFDGSVGAALGALAGKGIAKLVGRRGKDNDKIDSDSSGGSASSGNGSGMFNRSNSSTNDNSTDESVGQVSAGGAPSGSGANRSQNASLVAPAASRGMRRSRRGDFGQVTQQYGIQMVQGNDNYGTIHGSMGGANVGDGDYDMSFQSHNTGGMQQSNVGNNNSGTQFFGGSNNGGPGNPTAPQTPPPGTPPGTPPGGGGGNPPGGGGGGTPPGGTPPGTPPGGGGGTPPPGGGGKPGKPGSNPPALPPGQQPYGTLTGQPTPRALPPGQGPSTYGNTEGVQGAQETTQGPDRPDQKILDKGDKIYGLARDPGATPAERLNAQDKWGKLGFEGPFPREDMGQPETATTGTTFPTAPGTPTRTGRTGPSANVGQPQPTTAGPTLQTPTTPQPQTPVAGPTNPAAGATSPQGPASEQGQGEKMVMGPKGVSTQEVKSVNWERQMQGLEPGLGYSADYSGLDMSKIHPDAISRFMPNAPRTDINEQGGSAAGPYGPPAPAKKAGGRKTAAPKTQAKPVEGPKSVASKKAAGPAKKAAGTKTTAKPKEKK